MPLREDMSSQTTRQILASWEESEKMKHHEMGLLSTKQLGGLGTKNSMENVG